MSVIKAALRMLPVALLVVLGLLCSAAPASAATPWWSVTSSAIPANLPPGGTGEIRVRAVNLGDAPAEGSTDPIVVKDKLPAGLTATAINSGSYLLSSVQEIKATSCDLATLSCVYEGAVGPYEELPDMFIQVAVAGSPPAQAENEATVSGGAGATVSASDPVAMRAGDTDFGVENVALRPAEENGAVDLQAGSHPFSLTTTLELNQTENGELTEYAEDGGVPSIVTVGVAKDLKFALPPGLLGNPQAIPQCTAQQFTAKGSGFGLLIPNFCPDNTAVGVADIEIGQGGALAVDRLPLFNLVPLPGEPARFGFFVTGVPVYLDTSVRSGSDYGVQVESRNLSQIVEFHGAQVTFWGVPGDPRHDASRGWDCLQPFLGACTPPGEQPQTPFLTLPTSCGPLSTTLLADSWSAPSEILKYESTLDEGSPPLAMTGCSRLRFEPSISVAPDGPAGSTPTGLTVGLHLPQGGNLNPTGLAQADVRSTRVTLPIGVQLSPAAADGLLACSTEEIGFEGVDPQTQMDRFSADLANCPDASKVGTVVIKTPLLADPLEGAVYLAAQNANPFGSLLALYIVARDPVSGVLVKLAGQVTPDPLTGQLVSTFENTPQLPFEDLELHFFGSARAPLTTPAACGFYTTEAAITPWSGEPPAEASSQFQITSGPNGAPCANPPPFAPGFNAETTNIQAGAFTPFTLTMSRPDGNQTLSRIEMQLPPGLSGMLSSVKLCPEPQASEGTCGADSLVGHTVVSAGLGADPYTVTGGRVYITGPYKGAPFGLSVVNPAVAGPFNLGTVVVRATVNVDPHTAALSVKSEPLPTILDGIPLQLQRVNVTIDREKFTFNPTNCNKMAVNGTLRSAEGAAAAVSSSFQVTTCANLAFKPGFKVSTQGKISKRDGASLTAKVTYPPVPPAANQASGEANIASVKVDLPKQLPSRLTTLQKACIARTFETNPAGCPAASIVGRATADTPVLPVPLTGPAYFVSHGGEAFPSLIIVLQGYGVTVDLVATTFISHAGITSSTFKQVPDVPFSMFTVNLPEGKFSALGANLPAKAKGSSAGRR